MGAKKQKRRVSDDLKPKAGSAMECSRAEVRIDSVGCRAQLGQVPADVPLVQAKMCSNAGGSHTKTWSSGEDRDRQMTDNDQQLVRDSGDSGGDQADSKDSEEQVDGSIGVATDSEEQLPRAIFVGNVHIGKTPKTTRKKLAAHFKQCVSFAARISSLV
jgi:hypothetical protein